MIGSSGNQQQQQPEPDREGREDRDGDDAEAEAASRCGRRHLAEPAAGGDLVADGLSHSLVGRYHAAAVGKIPHRAGRLAIEQAGQEHHLVWSCRLARIDQGDLEVVLAVALDGQRASHRQVDDRGRGLSGIDLAVDQQAGLCDRNLRRRERDRDGDIGIVGHDLRSPDRQAEPVPGGRPA